MGKKLSDLPISDPPSQPLPTPPSTDIRDQAWFRFTERIQTLLDSDQYQWAADTLSDILASVERTQHMTAGQERAVDNIEAARDGYGRGSRRYEGFNRRRGW